MKKCRMCKEEEASGRDKLCNSCREQKKLERDREQVLEYFTRHQKWSMEVAEERKTA